MPISGWSTLKFKKSQDQIFKEFLLAEAVFRYTLSSDEKMEYIPPIPVQRMFRSKSDGWKLRWLEEANQLIRNLLTDEDKERLARGEDL